MKMFKIRLHIIILFVFLYIYNGKLRRSHASLQFLNDHAWEVSKERFENETGLNKILHGMKETPVFLLFNRYALNITLNWLCNVVNFENLHRRIIAIALDEYSYEKTQLSWPKLKVVLLEIDALKTKFHSGSAGYQMMQLLRSRLSAYLAEKGIDFWMIQTDTYWMINLFDKIDVETVTAGGTNILFDREGSEGLLSNMIVGAHLFVKSDKRSIDFFNKASQMLLDYYATDNNLYGILCATEFSGAICSLIPYWTISNWRWHTIKVKQLPAVLQFDGVLNSAQKLETMQSIGALFVKESTLNCMQPAVCVPGKIQSPKDAASLQSLIDEGTERSATQFILTLFQNLFESIYMTVPGTETFLRRILFPYYAYFIVFA